MDEHFDIDDLIHYFAGEGSAAERARVEAWIAASAENRDLARALEAMWRSAGARPPRHERDVTALWAGMEERIDQYERLRAARVGTPEPVSGRRQGRLHGPAPTRRDSAPVASARRGSRRLSGGALRQAMHVAALVAVLAVGVFGAREVFHREGPRTEEVVMREIASGPGQRARVTLSDGTRVHLNVASKLTMPDEFASGRRELYLEGEAFFEVARDEGRPFVVHAGDAVVHVLGTSFDVRAYTDESEVEVVVAEGTVSVRSGADTTGVGTLLTRGEMAALRDTVIQKWTSVDLDRHMAWRDHRLVFRDASFGEVCRALSRWYALEIEVEGSATVPGMLNATFSTEPVGEILNVIAATLQLSYEREGRRVTFRANRP